jgi:hypothetical protein
MKNFIYAICIAVVVLAVVFLAQVAALFLVPAAFIVFIIVGIYSYMNEDKQQ